MKMSHELPGTTFSNVQERGTYNSEAKAVLTLRELEKWLVLAVASYHKSNHAGLQMPPASSWAKHANPETIASVRDPKAFLIDFLPVVHRNVGRAALLLTTSHITPIRSSLDCQPRQT